MAERAKRQELEKKFDRIKQLARSKNVARSAYESAFFQLAGQKNKVEKLEDAVKVLRNRCHDSNITDDDSSARLKPILVEIDLTQSKTKRLRERIDQGQIRAPISGRVSKRHRLTGESARDGEAVIDILEDNSIEAVLYVPQRIVDEFEIGKEINITLEPYHQSLRCTVDRLGDRFQTAPVSIKRFYYEDQPLLPVYLTPENDSSQVMAMRIGGTVKRPYEYRKAFRKMADQFKANFSRFSSSTESAAANVRGESK